jgi:hypothetical protein
MQTSTQPFSCSLPFKAPWRLPALTELSAQQATVNNYFIDTLGIVISLKLSS